MSNSNLKTLLMIVTTLIVSILSLGIIKPIIQIIFILIYIFICFLLLGNFSDNNLKIKKVIICILIIIECIFVFISTIGIGSISGYFERIKNFFIQQDNLNTNLFNEQIENIKEELKNTNYNIEQLNKDLIVFSDDLEKINFNDKIDENEIKVIVKNMKNCYEMRKDSFPELKTDIYSIEIFYKMFISEEAYYYCNILEAFNRFGINYQGLNINENTLFIWDMDNLYITYNMQKQNYNNMYLDENANGRSFYYSDYQVIMNRYSDTLDYGNWRRDYENYTVNEVEEKLDNVIMNYYKKYMMNFSTK